VTGWMGLTVAQHGLLRLLSYLLQTLSADQAFAEALNQPVKVSVPAKWAVQGSAGDFMIVVSASLAFLMTNSPTVHLLDRHYARIEPAIPSSDHQHCQCCAVPPTNRRAGFHQASPVVQGVLCPKLFARR
jgi:hypothetical protein